MSSPSPSPVLRVVPPPDDERSAARHSIPQGDDPKSDDTESQEISIEELYRRYAPYVAAVASRILGRQAEVQDVVQEVFASAVRGLKQRAEWRQTKSWLATVTVRSSMKQLRKRTFWHLFDLAEPPQYDFLADSSAGPEERQMIAEVYRALDRLPVKQRVAWVLRHVEGESLERTAVLCDCSLATVKRRISAAHQSIKRHLEGGHHGL